MRASGLSSSRGSNSDVSKNLRSTCGDQKSAKAFYPTAPRMAGSENVMKTSVK